MWPRENKGQMTLAVSCGKRTCLFVKYLTVLVDAHIFAIEKGNC